MKYKLINKKTGEEIFCDKITIDGFDYYVSDEEPIINDYCIDTYSKLLTRCNKTNYGSNSYDFFKKVIATNNPKIDIPKVVDEVENIAYNWLYDEETENKARQGYPLKPMEYGFINGYNKSQETHPFSEEDMIEFAEWCQLSQWNFNGNTKTWWSINYTALFPTTKELLQIWKEQKIKTLYYE